MIVRYDGYYTSGPVPWEEWHAGVRMHGDGFHFWRFFPDSTYDKCFRELQPCDFWRRTESLTAELLTAARQGRAPQIRGGQQLCIAGTCRTGHSGIVASFRPDACGDQVMEWPMTVLDDRIDWIVKSGTIISLVFHRVP